MAVTTGGDILYGADATNAYLNGDTIYTNEIPTFVPVYGNYGILSLLGQSSPASSGTPQQPKSPARQQCEQQALQASAQEKSDAASDAVTVGALAFGAVEFGFGVGGCAVGAGAGLFVGTTIAEFTGGMSSFGGAAVGCFTGGVDMMLNGLMPSATAGLITGGIGYGVGRYSATRRYNQRMQQCSTL